jgi:predicted ATPase/DNA-binding winged helix-turn-helix (wHTH) protein
VSSTDLPNPVDPVVVSGARHAVRFGPFLLMLTGRVLIEGGREVPLGDRAFDILVTLVEHAGTVVSKEDLIARAWPRRVVEEVNLRIHIAALRRALGDGKAGERYIVNIIGRGYVFIAKVSTDALDVAIPNAPTHRLPARLTHLVGRDKEVEVISHMVCERRLVTLVGAGGVGKSTLALAAAAICADTFIDGAIFIDLTTVSDPALVPMVLATAIGLSVQASDPVPALVRYLQNKHMLLVIDNCEHLISTTAETIATLLRNNERLHILATSREPLRTDGEWKHRIFPLDTPSRAQQLDLQSAVRIASIELFVERARSADQSFELTESNLDMVASVCHQLDGIPLAIELAAARMGQMSINHLTIRLKDQFLWDSIGRRTGAAHHQTLRATLDWSYALLTPSEQLVLQRLSIVRGSFNFGFGLGVCARDGLSEDEAARCILSLVDRSLITVDASGKEILHRLLYTTRTYAYDRLLKSADAGPSHHWHCQQIGRLMRQAELDWTAMSRDEWVKAYEFALEDVRAALDWSLGCSGDALLGARVTAWSIPFGFQLTLTEEFRDRAEQALASLARHKVSDALTETRLNNALVELSKHLGDAAEHANPALTSSIAAGSLTQQTQFLVSRAISAIESGEYERALHSALQLSNWAESVKDSAAIVVARRVRSQTEHFRGNHGAARQLAEWVLDSYVNVAPLCYISMPVDHRVSMRIILARALWIEGFPDQAKEIAARAVAHAEADNVFSLCQALALAACPVAFWRGDSEEARALTTRLIAHATRYRLDGWRRYGESYAKAGEIGVDQDPSTSGPAAPDGLIAHTVLTIAADAGSAMGIGVPQSPPDSWCSPELVRLHARRQAGSADGRDRAVEMLIRSMEMAELQNALSWQLRGAIDLASLYREMRRAPEGRRLLSTVYDRYTEGHDTRDLCRARALLGTL